MAFRFPNIDEVKGRLGLAPQQPPAGSRRGSRDSEDDYAYDEDYGEYSYDDGADYAQPGYVRPADKVAAASGRMPALVTSDDIRSRRRAAASEDAPDGSSSRSVGLESLFSSTAEPRASVSAAYPSAAPRIRRLVVIAPESIEDAERVASSLKERSVVVLACAQIPEALMKRVLDFSFGAASVLGAQVELLAPRVFAFAAGSALSEGEKAQLREQGVI